MFALLAFFNAASGSNLLRKFGGNMAKELKFEEMMKKLEQIVDELESGNMPLEDSLKKYEEGVKLIQACRKRLDETKRKVEVLIKKDGKTTLEPFKE